MVYFEKIRPETVIYGVLIIGAAWWLTKKGSELSDKYNPLDSDNKVNQAAQAGAFTDTLKYSNPILAAVDAALEVARKEYEIFKGAILN